MTKFVNFGLFGKKFGWFFNAAFYRAQSIALKEKHYFFKKNSFFTTFLDLELNFFELLAKKLAVWPNFNSSCPEEHFEENNVFKKILFLFFRLRAKRVRTMAKVSGCVLLTAFWLSRETIFGTFFWSSMNRFVTFRLFGKKIGVFVKTAFYHPIGSSCKKSLFQLKSPFSISFGLGAAFFGLLA